MTRHALTFARLQLTSWRGLLQLVGAVVMATFVGTAPTLELGPVLSGLSGPFAVGLFGLLVLGRDGVERRQPTLPIGPRARALGESLIALVPLAIATLLEPGVAAFVPFLLASALARSAAPGAGIGATLVLGAISVPAGVPVALDAAPAVVAAAGCVIWTATLATAPLLARVAGLRDPRRKGGAIQRPGTTPWRDALRGAALSGASIFAVIAPLSLVAWFLDAGSDTVFEVLAVATLTAIAFAPHGHPGGFPTATSGGSLAEALRRLPVPPATIARTAWILGLAGAGLAAALSLLSLFVVDLYNPGGGAGIGVLGLQLLVGGGLVFTPMTVWRLLGSGRWRLKTVGIAAAWGALFLTAVPTAVWLVDTYALHADLIVVGLVSPLVVPLLAALASYRDISRAAPARPA